ncbi:hypothetical protein KIN20_012154 [Parelaphostrongylus tenuis]|uniref:Helicase ATP-binding domain-containing protein n=1 Tax=Parelaphostrongylus tenuis TaxID=148309 RepID=A0AAD5MW09_PARTN|nr:hypothetical protein KIN20_012154 [Parelaphostrongylus tenuis]
MDDNCARDKRMESILGLKLPVGTGRSIHEDRISNLLLDGRMPTVKQRNEANRDCHAEETPRRRSTVMRRELTESEKIRIAANRAEAIRRAEERKRREALAAAAASGGPSTSSTSTATTSTEKKIDVPSYQGFRPSVPSCKGIPSNAPSCQGLASNAPSCQGAPLNIPPMFFPKSREFKPPTSAKMPKSNIHVTLSVFTNDKIKVQFSPYHSAVVEAIKSIPSRQYDSCDRYWTIAFSDLKKVSEYPQRPYGCKRHRAGVAFGIERGGRILLADEMGLGKSVQALTLARYYKAEWPLLIVCPSSVKTAWKTQINKFMPMIHKIFLVEKGSDHLPEARTSNTVAIMSYDQMVLKKKELEEANYYVIIFDESHMLKDGKAKRSKVAQSLSKRASRVILLSGTPALSRPAELFSQIKLVNGSLFRGFKNSLYDIVMENKGDFVSRQKDALIVMN